MADFGTVAAAIQLAETAYKLKKLCSEIRDAPADLLQLVEEVTLLSDLLSEIEPPTQCANVGGQRSWQRCRDHLTKSTNLMRQMTSDLENKLRNHRFTGAVRIYMKKDELSKAKSRLESIKATMTLAQQAYSFNILSRQNGMLLQEIRSIVTQSKNNVLTVQDSGRVPSTCSDPALKSSSNTSVEVSTRAENAMNRVVLRRRVSRVTKFDLRMPNWIFRRGVQVLIEQSNSSWGMNFRIYNQLNPEAEVLLFAMRGNWTKVVNLFQSGKASPFDVDPWGNTLLHIAACNADFQGCKLLLGYGLDPSLRSTFFGNTPLERLAEMEQHRGGLHQPHVNEVIALMVAADPEVYLECDMRRMAQLIRGFDGKGLSIVIDTKVPGYEKLDPLLRAKMAMSLCSPSLEALPVILGPDLSLTQAFNLLAAADIGRENHFMLLDFASKMIAISHFRKATLSSVEEQGDFTCSPGDMDNERSLSRWTSVISEIIQFESSSCKNYTIRGAVASWNELFTRIVRKWVQTLASLGADLERYGCAEKQHLTKNRGYAICARKSGKLGIHYFEIRHLLCGPSVNDWAAFVVPVTLWSIVLRSPQDEDRRVTYHDEYEMAGEFWDQIENPEIFGVPGAYISDDDYHQQRFSKQKIHGLVRVTGPVL